MAHLRLCNLVCGSTSASLITPDMSLPPRVRLLLLRLRGKCKCSAGAEHFWSAGQGRCVQAACRGAAHVSDVTALPLSPSHSAMMPSAV